MKVENNLNLRRILIFLVFTFIVTYAWTIFLIWPRTLGENAVALTPENIAINTLLTAVLMFFPAMGVLLTRLITGEGFKNSMLRLNLHGNIRYYLMAWFGPMILTLIGAILYFAIFPSNFSLAEFRGLTTEELLVFMVMLVSPLLNLVPCFGEEWGWRGYLLPKVAERMRFLPSVLLTGLIWGLWHAPMIVAGHNYGMEYGGYPWLGIVAMCIYCIVAGVFLSYITLRTKSCWPAIFAHGAINGTAGLGLLFYNYNGDIATLDVINPFVGPIPTGVIGGIAYIVISLLIVHKIHKEERF